MGTNFYLHIIPSKERKKELYNAIEANDFPLINKLYREMYNNIYMDYGDDEIRGGVIHLGKRSGGWKFCWNPNIFVVRNGHLEDVNGQRKYIPDPDTAKYTYPLTKKGLHDFIFRENTLVYDEYDELQDKKEFWKMALEWEQEDGWDSAKYEEYERKQNPSYRLYPCTGDLVNLLEKEGYKFTSWTCSDFYSDGLRFASFTDFS